MPNLHVAVLVGSLRAGSYSLALAKALPAIAPKGLSLDIVPIGDLPFYNPDLEEGTPPEAWTTFRKTMSERQAVIFVTPEYNRSVPAVLKNALDVGSRPYGSSIWSGRPALIISSSPGAISGFAANHHLRQSLVFLDMPTVQQPEVYLSEVDKKIEADGTLKPDTAKFLGSALETFAGFAAKNS